MKTSTQLLKELYSLLTPKQISVVPGVEIIQHGWDDKELAKLLKEVKEHLEKKDGK